MSERFQPSELLVQDVSGAPLSSHANLPSPPNCAGGCRLFYAITIVSMAFKGITVVKQHRLVNAALKKEIEGIHGLRVRSWFPLFILYIDHSRSSKLSRSDDMHMLCILDAIFISQLRTGHRTSVTNKLDDESAVFCALRIGIAVPLILAQPSPKAISLGQFVPTFFDSIC